MWTSVVSEFNQDFGTMQFGSSFELECQVGAFANEFTVTDKAFREDNRMIGLPVPFRDEATGKVKVSDKVKAYTEFTPPTVDEVKDYLLEKNITSIDPIKFVAHYESTGWVRGKNKIKNWKACVYTWLK